MAKLEKPSAIDYLDEVTHRTHTHTERNTYIHAHTRIRTHSHIHAYTHMCIILQ
jgi:hypothetical protein